MLFSDESTYSNFGFRHSPAEEAAADKKAIELLKNSPYGQKLDSAGLFLKALQASAPAPSRSVDGAPWKQHVRERHSHTYVCAD